MSDFLFLQPLSKTTKVQKKERFQQFIEHFVATQPDPETELVYTDPYQLMVAVMLSAQCTDKRVNMITPAFFQRFPNVKSLSEASVEEVFELVKSCSYPNSKSKHLVGMAKMLVNDFRSVVPDDVDELQKLPGIGRKSANVIASVVFSKPAMAVDTHVFRVSRRIGLTTHPKNPYDAEMQLIKYIPEQYIPKAHHWLILHGRYVCQARKPKCDECKIAAICQFYHENEKKKNTILNKS